MKLSVRKTALCALWLLFAGFSLHGQIIRTVAGMDGLGGYTGDGGLAIDAQIGQPNGVVTDAAGNLYVSDAYNNVVRKVTPAGVISTVAGTGVPGYNGDGIAADTAQLNEPIGLAIDIYGNLYIADNANFRVRKVDTAGIITTVAGVGGIGGFGNAGDGGPATSANLYAIGIAVDQYQNIYIADGNTAIRKVTHATGLISTVAGSHSFGYSGDGGPATSAALANPTGVAVDASGNIYIADYTNNAVRMVNTAPTPIISTVAGKGPAYGGYSGDYGVGSAKELNQPYGVAVAHDSLLYIADMGNNRIRLVKYPYTTDSIYTVAGTGSFGSYGDGGLATAAHLAQPTAVCVNSEGSFFIADNDPYGPGSNDEVREVSNPTTVTVIPHPGSDICIGTPVVYYANVHNAVLGESYQWVYNGADVTTDTAYYADSAVANGDQVYCIVSFPAASDIVAMSDTVTMIVNPLLVPSINITSDTNNVCQGTPLTFSATSVNGGTAPVYQWQVNGIPAHTGSTYTFDPSNAEVVNCFMTSNAICATPDTITSSLIRTQINDTVVMTVSIMTTSADSLNRGDLATFLAEPTNEGLSPQFQWYVNGAPIPGATSNIFNSDSLSGNDTVYCKVSGSLLCALPLTATSSPVVVNVNDLGVAQAASENLSLVLMPNPNKGVFTLKGTINSAAGADIKITVTDVLGQVAYSGTLPQQQGKVNARIVISDNLPDGMYILHAASGNSSSEMPFVVKK